MALTGVKRKDKGKESRRTRATPCSQRRELASELKFLARDGTRPSNFAPDGAARSAALRAPSRSLSSPIAVPRPPPRGRADSRGAGPGRCRPADTHLLSRPAPRPLRGSSPGAALPVGRRPRSSGSRRGWPRAPHRSPRTWRRRRLLLLLLQPASPSLPAGGRRARGSARPFSARRRQGRRGSRGPGSGRGAGGEGGSGPRARAPGVGLGPWVRVSKSVSHGLGLGIAYGESKRRGHGSSTAGGHTGNGHGPRALGAGLRGAGRGPGHRPRRAVT